MLYRWLETEQSYWGGLLLRISSLRVQYFYRKLRHSLPNRSLCRNEVFASGKLIYMSTNSQSAIEAINSPVVDSLIVSNCKRILNEIGSSNKVTILWVHSHKGISGTEKANSLAWFGTFRCIENRQEKCGKEMANETAHNCMEKLKWGTAYQDFLQRLQLATGPR